MIQNMIQHKYKVGQTVRVTLRANPVVPTGTYEVVRLLPPDASGNQYHLKSTRDGRERVVRESDLA